MQMEKRWFLAMVMVLSGAAMAEEMPGLNVGTTAPALPGVPASNKVRLVEFWFTQCGACRAAVPELKKLAQNFASRGLEIIAPSLDAEAAVQSYKSQHGIPYRLVPGMKASAKAYGVEMYPTVFLVGKNGKILWKGFDFSGDPEFAFILDAALNMP